ncbi:hypothetical protein BDZ97DRAFT_1791737 [Flammula alnicola]|nr:hypothetical protein BDZ97DRAFT_1846504 [Flammula alnicola]KAF8970055.1 hypothetical protein BDZ97DRAFT_1791737 [Flammula alnicola]
MSAGSSLNCTMMSSPRPPATSASWPPARTVTDTLALVSTVSSLNSCSKAVTSPRVMALVLNLSTEINSLMRTFA